MFFSSLIHFILFIDSEDSLNDADNDHDIKGTLEQQSQMAFLRRQIEKKAEATDKPPNEVEKSVGLPGMWHACVM